MISNLPRELESEILSRVPATSLGQLRFTCKLWYALFKDPRFIKKNLECKTAAAATQMVLKKDQSVYSFDMDLNGINNRYDQFIQFTGKLRSLKDSEDVKISEIFQCEGLFLCKTEESSRLVVWNPCTRQTTWIQSRLSRKCRAIDQKFFLGYENNRCYKILSFSRYQNEQNATVVEFEMYEYSWRVLDVATRKWFSLWNFGASFQGNTYWLDSDIEENNFMLKFDFTTERFKRLPLPFENDDDEDEDLVAVLSVFRDEKLVVLHHYVMDLKIKIWMTNDTKSDDEGKDLSWSEFLVVDFGKFMIDSLQRVMSFLVDEENKRVMCCDTDDEDELRTRIYIVGEDIHKQVYREMIKDTDEILSPLMVSYVPSLVQIPARQGNPGGGKRKKVIIN